MKPITGIQIQRALSAACLCGTLLATSPSDAAPAKPAKSSVTAFTWYVTNGALPPPYAHQEELRGQVTPRTVVADYTHTHYEQNSDKHGYHSVAFTWHGVLPAALQRQFRTLAEHVAFEKPRPGPPRVGGSVHTLTLTYANGHKASGVPTDIGGWNTLLADVAQLAHRPKK